MKGAARIDSAALRAGGAAPATIPSLDGLRAVAVALVFFAHSGLEKWVPGGLGVTVFFVLSGFLITTLMRTEHASTGQLDFPGFYLRRFLRLTPPLLIVAAAAAALAGLGWIDSGFSTGGLLAMFFYVGNYFDIATDFHGLPSGLGLIWSLAIEEHYYLFYPPLAALLLTWRPQRAAALLALLCALVLAWRCWRLAQGASVDAITMSTDTRVDAILVGCLLAFWRNPWLSPPAAARPWREGLLLAASLLLLAATLLVRDETFRLTARFTLQSLAVAVIIALAVARPGWAPFRFLNSRPLVYLGAVSYTLYLTHHLILLGLARAWPSTTEGPGWAWAGRTLLAAALTLAVAEPMRRWVEQPCAAWRRRLHAARSRRGLRAGPPHTARTGISS